MYAVEMSNITKRFARTCANDQITFQVKKGEIHSLLGENGAGKTTLMKMLYGMIHPDAGEIRLHGKVTNISNPSVAINKGIAMVHQHFMLVDTMTVAENIVLGYETTKGPFFDLASSIRQVEEISARYGLQINPRQKVEELPVGAKQRVEILKALYRKADILILDEPTAVLTPLEVEELFRVLAQLKSNGKTIIMITHKLNETMQAADRATVLRAGKVVDTVEVKHTSPAQLAELMVGRQVSFDKAPPSTYPSPQVILELRQASMKKNNVQVLKNLNLTLRSGEVLGIAGVEGNGQTELIEALTALHPLESGELYMHGKQVQPRSPLQMIELGIGHIPEDRNKLGLVGEFSIEENVILGYHRRRAFQRKGLLQIKKIKSYAEEIRKKFMIKSEGIFTKAKALSGGNQQKIVIGRVLSQNPDVIIAAQPTRGVDIGAIQYIHEQLIKMRDAGKAVLLISAELDEIRKLSDRIAVIYEGQIVKSGPADQFTEHELGELMTGGALKGQRGEADK